MANVEGEAVDCTTTAEALKNHSTPIARSNPL
nr:hypothetical protein HUO10_005283 [Paraburkholderia busanensis]